jgi:predicted DNA-binding ribbon-helix-helix protein
MTEPSRRFPAPWHADKIPGGYVVRDASREQPPMPPPKAPRGKSLVRKRNIKLDGHKTSVTMEDTFWDAFKEIAAAQGTSVNRLIATIDHERHERPGTNLSSAIRLFIIDYYRSRMRP